MRILYVNDVHYHGPSEPHYPKTVITMPLFFDLLRACAAETDLLIVGGDAVNRGSARIEELESFRDALDAAGIPYLVVAGNHDIAPSAHFAARYPGMEDMEPVPLIETRFGQVFGERGLRHVCELTGWKGVFLSVRDDDPDGQLPWLEGALADRQPALVFCHYPITPARSGGFCQTWEYRRIGGIRERLLELALAGNVRAWFCGHLHINSRVRVGRMEQIVTGALGLATCAYRLLDISPAAIRITTHRLPDVPDWLADAMNPDRSQDDAHPTIEAYHWGNDEERDFTLAY